jgi:hypothetical protein
MGYLRRSSNIFVLHQNGISEQDAKMPDGLIKYFTFNPTSSCEREFYVYLPMLGVLSICSRERQNLPAQMSQRVAKSALRALYKRDYRCSISLAMGTVEIDLESDGKLKDESY